MEQPRTTAASNGAADDAVYVTEQGLAALEHELRRLHAQKTGEVAEQLREARSFGSAAGNDELWAIREDEAILDARIARLEGVIARARIIDPRASDGGVAIGSTVALEDLSTGTTARYRIVGVHDPAPPADVTPVSAASPVGRAVIGRRPGARVSVELPGGRARELRLLQVEDEREAQRLAPAS